jgi:hypothetical protein
MPVLAAAKNPPVKMTAGTPYIHEYSGGSVGPIYEAKLGYRVKTN